MKIIIKYDSELIFNIIEEMTNKDKAILLNF